MAVNPDFRDLLSIFNDEGVEYLVVGAHAVMYYTEPRYTKDINIIMGVEGIEFEPAWQRRVPTTYGDVPTHVLCKEDVMRSKRAAGRPQDLLDLEKLR